MYDEKYTFEILFCEKFSKIIWKKYSGHFSTQQACLVHEVHPLYNE